MFVHEKIQHYDMRRQIAPLVAAGLISAAGSIAGNVLGNKGNNKNVDKQIAAQREENEKARAYNREMAEQANKWSIEQWERENAYNTPQAIMQRLKQGGLNPDLMYGQGAGNLTAANSPAVTPTAAAEPTDMSAMSRYRTFGDAVGQAFQNYYSAKQAEANIELAESQANKNNADAEGTNIQNNWIDKLNGNTLDIGNATIVNLNASTAKTEAERDKIGAEIQQVHTNIDHLRESIELIKANIGNLNFNQAMARMRYMLDEKLNRSQLEKIAHENGLTTAQTMEIRQKLPYLIQGMIATTMDTTSSAMLKDVQRLNEQLKGLGIRVSNQGLILENKVRLHKAKQAEAYDDATDNIGIIGSTIRVATQMVQDVFGGSVGTLLK